MEPITAGVISGLVVRALGGAAGSVPRLFSRNRTRQVNDAISDLTAAANSFLLPAISNLGSQLTENNLSKVGSFLGSVEADVFVRSVAIAVLSEDLSKNQTAARGQLRKDLSEQLRALLVVRADLERQAAGTVSGWLLDLLYETFDRANQLLLRRNRSLQEKIVRRARAEKAARHLESLAERNRMLLQYNAEEADEILSFADQYRALLHKRTGEIVPAYFDIQRRVPINKLYVPPRFSVNDGVEQNGINVGQAIAADVNGLLAAAYRIVVLGDPGAGKSTLVQSLAHAFSDPERAANIHFGVVPFIVPVRSYEEWKSQFRGTVADFISSYIYENFQISAPVRAIGYLLLTGRAFVAFDGLDELLDISKRREICDVILNFADLYSTTTVLVTSRKVGYFEAPINPSQFRVTSLLNFADDDVARYVTNWFSVDDKMEKVEKDKIIKAFLEESLSVRDIRSNALMLGLMCNIYRGVRTIPRNRADLYEQCAEMLFERWDASRGISSIGPLKSDARAALQNIALWMFVDPGRANGVPERDINRRLVDFWNRRYDSHDRATQSAKELLGLWKGRMWILTDVGSRGTDPQLVYKFTHQTFMEFFAAMELVRRNPSPTALWQALREQIMSGGWDVVSQVAIQRLDASYFDASDEIVKLLVGDCPHVDVPARINLLGFAVRHLDGLSLQAETLRNLTRAALDLAMLSMPTVSEIFSYDEYDNSLHEHFREIALSSASPERRDHVEELLLGDALEPHDSFEPLLMLIQAPTAARELVFSETVAHLSACFMSEQSFEAAKALLLALSFDDVIDWAAEKSVDDYDHQGLSQIAISALKQSANLIDQDRILHLARINAWTAIVSCWNGLVSPGWMIETVGNAAVVCTLGPFGRTSSEASGTTIMEELLRAYFGLYCPEVGNRKQLPADRIEDTLAIVGERYLRDMHPFDSTWMRQTDLYGDIVNLNLYVVNTRNHDDFDLDDQDENPLDSQGSTPNNPEAFFGAAVLLAAVVEFERWNIIDHSEDQAGSLSLGPLQILEGLFIARCTGIEPVGLDKESVRASGLRDSQVGILFDWAEFKHDVTANADTARLSGHQ